MENVVVFSMRYVRVLLFDPVYNKKYKHDGVFRQ